MVTHVAGLERSGFDGVEGGLWAVEQFEDQPVEVHLATPVVGVAFEFEGFARCVGLDDECAGARGAGVDVEFFRADLLELGRRVDPALLVGEHVREVGPGQRQREFQGELVDDFHRRFRVGAQELGQLALGRGVAFGHLAADDELDGFGVIVGAVAELDALFDLQRPNGVVTVGREGTGLGFEFAGFVVVDDDRVIDRRELLTADGAAARDLGRVEARRWRELADGDRPARRRRAGVAGVARS